MADTLSPPISITVRTGADQMLTDASGLIKGKRIGLLTNHTGRLSDGCSIIDALGASGICQLKALYGPEHGLTGTTPDGKAVNHTSHPAYGVPVYSLYGKHHKPTKEMLAGIDLLVCDIQDVGARFYTFISTVALMMEACAETNIPFILLDRPNPIRGLMVDGPIRVQSLKSFVGWMPIPVMHGLTLGELCSVWNGEGWLANSVRAKLEVVPMQGWRRSMWFDETGLPWIPPSPNMKTLDTAIVYPGMCFIEGTTASEGRGTAKPFQMIGAPWLDADRVLAQLEQMNPQGVLLRTCEFSPREIPGVASQPKFDSEVCRGIEISVVKRECIAPVQLGIMILAAMKRVHPQEMILRHRRFDILTGNASIREQLDRDVPHAEIVASWSSELNTFRMIRSKYLLYKEA
ncbi:MAG: DUF1343 domain-containing protein [bacterium]